MILFMILQILFHWLSLFSWKGADWSCSNTNLVSTLSMFSSVLATICLEALWVIFSSSGSAASCLPSQDHKALSPLTFSIHFTFLCYRAKYLHMSFIARFSIRQTIPIYPMWRWDSIGLEHLTWFGGNSCCEPSWWYYKCVSNHWY